MKNTTDGLAFVVVAILKTTRYVLLGISVFFRAVSALFSAASKGIDNITP